MGIVSPPSINTSVRNIRVVVFTLLAAHTLATVNKITTNRNIDLIGPASIEKIVLRMILLLVLFDVFAHL